MAKVGSLAVLLFLGATLSGCLASDQVDPTGPDMPGAVGARPDVVVAFIDSGVNPYHVAFQDGDPRTLQHPSTYLTNYPADALPLNLTFDAADYNAAVRADCEAVWKNTQPGQLYYVPGTKIVGMYAAADNGVIDCAADEPRGGRALDGQGHGTMVATKVAHPDYGSCPDCRIVAVQGYNEAALIWTKENAHWIDVESNSWGPNPVPWPDAAPADPAGGETQTFMTRVEEAAQVHLSLWASSNGVFGAFGVLGHPSLLRMKLPPSVVIVGAHDSGYITAWHSFPPHVVSDGCNDWAGEHDSIDGSNDSEGGGTSSATPYVAGAAGQILLDARRILEHHGVGIHAGVAASGTGPQSGPLADGNFTLEEWKDLLKKTADPRPTAQAEDGPRCELTPLYDPLPVQWDQVPAPVPQEALIGYGVVDRLTVALAHEVLRGNEDMPNRAQSDQFFAVEGTARQAIYDNFASS